MALGEVGKRCVRCLVCAACAVALSGCFGVDQPPPDVSEGVPPITTAVVQRDADVQYYPSDEPLRLAIENFNLSLIHI